VGGGDFQTREKRGFKKKKVMVIRGDRGGMGSSIKRKGGLKGDYTQKKKEKNSTGVVTPGHRNWGKGLLQKNLFDLRSPSVLKNKVRETGGAKGIRVEQRTLGKWGDRMTMEEK